MAHDGPSASSPIPGVTLVLLPADDEAFRRRVFDIMQSLPVRATGADLQAALRSFYPRARVHPLGPLRPVGTHSEAIRYVYRHDEPAS